MSDDAMKVDEPQNHLTEQFLQEEWTALQQLRVRERCGGYYRSSDRR